MTTRKIVSAPLAGAAYVKGHKGSHLVHAVEIRDGEPVRALCGKVKPEHILDDADMWDVDPVTCQLCAKELGR